MDLPHSPGCYLHKDRTGKIIYVGKAKSLKARLASYFSGKREIKTRMLVSKAATLEWILTETEYEALLLENTLIKRHAPRYNINLKDGKTYPAIRITNEEFPRVFRTRRIIDDGDGLWSADAPLQLPLRFKHCDDIAVEKTRKAGGSRVMLLNISCLVSPDKAGLLGSELENIDKTIAPGELCGVLFNSGAPAGVAPSRPAPSRNQPARPAPWG